MVSNGNALYCNSVASGDAEASLSVACRNSSESAEVDVRVDSPNALPVQPAFNSKCNEASQSQNEEIFITPKSPKDEVVKAISSFGGVAGLRKVNRLYI